MVMFRSVECRLEQSRLTRPKVPTSEGHTTVRSGSEIMMRPRRSKRSASQPAPGVRIPVIPKLKKHQADNQSADPVRSYKKNPNATAVALEPSDSTSPPAATR
jgi:hypothetical protein